MAENIIAAPKAIIFFLAISPGNNVLAITKEMFPEAKPDNTFDYCDPSGNAKKETRLMD